MRDRLLYPVLGSAAAVVAASLLVRALEPFAPVLSLGVIYVLAVFPVAIAWGVVWSLVVAIASLLTFNFFFLEPVHTFDLAHGQDWSALAVYLVTAVVVSQLATMARRRAAEAERREREAALLADAAAALLQEAPLDEFRTRAAQVLADEDAVALERFEAAVDALLELSRERREAEALRRSDAVKTVILQTVSHDFRTPLATMRAAVDGLEDAELRLSDEDRAALLETIRLETARLSRLVENVLDLSRIQAGAAAPHPALWAPDDLIGQAVAEVSDASRVRITAPDGLPAARVDAVQLQRALVNLIENALTYAQGEVEVHAAELGDLVVLDVLDRGPGIDPERPVRGLGLGLAIARGFTAANGGTLQLDARPGGGTRARLSLPAERVPSEAVR